VSADDDSAGLGTRLRASIVILTFRRTGPLRELLESLVPEAASDDFEVVLADDGSGDEIARLADELAPRFRRLRLVTGENAGPGVARNRGVAAAAADVLLFVDSDCLAEPGWARTLAAAVEGGAAIAFGPTRSAVPALEPFVHSIVSEGELYTFTNVGVARAVFERLGGFRPEVSRVAEDRDFFARARAAGLEFTYVPGAVINHPPRPREIRFSDLWNPWPAFRDMATYYESRPEARPRVVEKNRDLLRKGAIKLAVAAMPFGLPALVAHSFYRRHQVNRQLEAAGVAFRVPANAALKYGLLQPALDLVQLARRARAGFGWLRP